MLYLRFPFLDASPKAISGRTSYFRVRLVTESVLYLRFPFLDASPKAISGRTSYFRVRLEFLLQPQVIRQLFNGGRFGPPLGITPASTCPWLDHPVSGLQQPTLLALLRLAFASAPPSLINLAFCRNSPVHSTKGTPSPFNGL